MGNASSSACSIWSPSEGSSEEEEDARVTPTERRGGPALDLTPVLLPPTAKCVRFTDDAGLERTQRAETARGAVDAMATSRLESVKPSAEVTRACACACANARDQDCVLRWESRPSRAMLAFSTSGCGRGTTFSKPETEADSAPLVGNSGIASDAFV